MHATYTFDFGFELSDESKSVKKVEVTSISVQTSLPNGDLKVIPYAHVSNSANGGSIPSTLKYED